MKKLIACTLSLILALTLTGCGNDTPSDSNQTVLTFWGHQNEPWNASYQRIAAEFEAENPDIKINFEFFPYDQFESKVQTSLISKGGGADIYELWGGWGLDFASTGALAPIPEALGKQIIEDSYPSSTGALIYEDHLYGLPMEFNIENGAMLVNKNLMEELNLTVPTTWAELRETARLATVKEGNAFKYKGFDFVNWDSVPYTFISMILSSGGEYLNEDGSFNIQTPEAKAALNELYEMVAVDGVTDMEGLAGGSNLEGYQQLFAGTTVMVPRGPWTIAEGSTSFGLSYGTDFDYVSMPFFTEKPAFAAETGWSMAVNGSSEKQEAAFKFIEYFFQDEVILQHNVDCAMIPAKKSVAHNPEFVEKMPFAAPLIEILDSARFIGYFNTDQFKEQVNNTFTDFVSGKIANVDEALAQMEANLNNILK